jgi:chloramphenicol 3-O-phosphotransferase
MKLVFLYGPAASGKLTIAREIGALTGFAVFHNHLIVDAVAAVFPFGSAPFVKLRERFWMETFAEAAAAGRSLVFTFAPEVSVDVGFPDRVRTLVEGAGGEVAFVRLTLPVSEQERRIAAPSRREFGKLRSLDLLRQLRAQFRVCEAAMPEPRLVIDTAATPPDEAARRIVAQLGLRPSEKRE